MTMVMICWLIPRDSLRLYCIDEDVCVLSACSIGNGGLVVRFAT